MIVYGAKAMLPVKIDAPMWRCSIFNEEENEAGLRCATEVIHETQDVAHIQDKYKKADSYLDKLSCQPNKGNYNLTKKVHITYARNFCMEPTNSKI